MDVQVTRSFKRFAAIHKGTEKSAGDAVALLYTDVFNPSQRVVEGVLGFKDKITLILTGLPSLENKGLVNKPS